MSPEKKHRLNPLERLQMARLAMERNDWSDALGRFDALTADFPDLDDAWNGKGAALYHQGSREEAVPSFLRALELNDSNPDAWNNLGNCFREIGRFTDAVNAAERALSLRRDYPEAWYHLAIALMELGDNKRARHALEEAIRLRPEYPDAWVETGRLCCRTGNPSEALRWFNRACRLAPLNISYRVGLAEVYTTKGMFSEAADIFRRCLKIDPGNGTVHSMLLMTMGYIPDVTSDDIKKESVKWGIYHALGKSVKKINLNASKMRRIRIGYVSFDFNFHTVGLLFRPILRHMDREGFEVFCYDARNLVDGLTEEMRGLADKWRNISGLDDDTAAELILGDDLDILVDLAGHSGGNRLGIFALRPAPIQVSWLGYSHTTGLPTMDFYVADPVTVPEEEERLFTEQVVRLPHFRLCYDPPVPSPEIITPPAVDNGYITFGSFNNIVKMTPDVVALWARVLQEVPDSRLVLKWKSFASASVRKRYRNMFRKCGISSERLEFREETSRYLMLMEYGDVDIALDPFPFTGGITSCDALWMGVPVVTLAGHTPIGRQTSAILHELGLTELIASDADDYIRIIRELAGDRERLQTLRMDMRARMMAAPFCSARDFVLSLERLFIELLERDRQPYFNHGLKEESLIAQSSEAASVMFNAGKTGRALELCGSILSQEHNHPQATRIRALIAHNNGNTNEAISLLKGLLIRSPSDADSHFNLGHIYGQQGKWTKSVAHFKKVISLKPENVAAQYSLAGVLAEGGFVEQGLDLLHDAILRKQDENILWSGLAFIMNYSHCVSAEKVFEMHVRSGKCLLKNAGRYYSRWSNEKNPGKKLRIGYVSGDFGMHPVGYFMFNTLRNHDRETFEVVCYSNRSSDDNLTCFFRDYSSRWRSLWKIPTKEAAKIIRQDRIDILVDLSGYSKDNRLDIFALKPAPIQVTWLGYPNTTGLKTIDYRMTDLIADPPGESDKLNAERLYRLPDGFLCFYPHPDSPGIGPLPAKKMKSVTFGSFNNLSKITPEVIKVWARILKKVPSSRIFLKRQSFKDPAVREYFTEQFAAEGVGPECLLLKPHVGGAIEHLSLYGKVDIALDPFPYNGTTSTCESLWMGVPVVTLRGDRHAARVGASILSQVGLTDMVADSYEDYVAIAVRLAHDLESLQFMRNGLRERITASPLCDGKRFTHDLEDAFQNMWRDWCRQ